MLKKVKGDFNAKIKLSEEAKRELEWWAENLETINGKQIFELDPDLVIYSDASLKGWGAVCNGAFTKGPWTMEQTTEHINF